MRLTERVNKFAETAAPIFQANDWKWGRNGEMRVPTEADIRSTVWGLITACDNMLVEDRSKRFTYASTGRITVVTVRGSEHHDSGHDYKIGLELALT